jgi:hypothetical protein
LYPCSRQPWKNLKRKNKKKKIFQEEKKEEKADFPVALYS